jgi:hypothetical protein
MQERIMDELEQSWEDSRRGKGEPRIPYSVFRILFHTRVGFGICRFNAG